MDATQPAPGPQRHVLLSALRWLLPLAFLIGTLVLAGRELESFDLAALERTLLAIPTIEAAAVALFALAAVAYTGLIDLAAARWLKIDLAWPALLRLSFVANALANTLNLSGAVGSGVRLLGLSAHQVPLKRGAALIGLQVLALPTGLSVLVIAALAMGAVPPAPDATMHWLAIAVLVAAALYLPVYLVLTGNRRLMAWLPAEQGQPPLTLRLHLAGLSLVDWVLAAATLWFCLHLAGAVVSPLLLLAAFGCAAVLGLVSLIPGGFGVMDGVLLLALTAAGVPQGRVGAGLFLFRIVYYLLPMLAGLWLGGGMLAQRVPALARWRVRLAENPLLAVLGVPAGALAEFGVRILALLTFGAGVLLLVSALLPSLHHRMLHASSALALPAFEGSHWLSVLTGVLLLGLARGIDGRVRVAYRLVQWTLWLSALLALSKGLHWGEALFLLAVSGLLRTRRSAFSRRAMSLSSARTLGWLLGLLSVVGVFFAIGVAEVLGDDSFDMLATGAEAHTSRLARGLGAALLGLVIYLIWQAFAVRRPQLPRPGRAELEQARALYREHGGGEFAHLTFMGDKHLFWAADHRALIAYGAVRDRLVALGAPSGDEAALTPAVLDFRRFADSHDRVPVFYEVLEPDLARFHDLGFDLFKLGELALVPLAEFSLTGKRWEDLRQAVNRAGRERLEFRMAQPPFDTALQADLERVSDAWLAEKGQIEKGFSLGRFDPAYFAWGPLALVYRDDELIAFANLQPPYGPRGHASVDLMRYLPDTPRGTMDFLFAHVLQWSRDEGHATFSLGMAPLSNVGANPYARLNERLVALAFRYGNRYYNYQGVRRYKEKFRPQWVGAYLAYPRGLNVPVLLTDIAALVAGGYRHFLFG